MVSPAEMTTSKRLMLLDSASLYYRAFYGVPESITSADGTPVNAVRGFLDMIATLITTYSPSHLVACWDDDWRPAFRVAAIASYKAQRVQGQDATGIDVELTPPGLVPQVPIISAILAAFGIARIGHPGYEADDVMATLADRAADAGAAVDIVTGDRDLFQLVDDVRQIRVLYTAKGGVRNLDLVDQARLQERYAVADGRQYADFAVLRGDPSDGLPGVRGIGEKTAASLLATWGDLAGLLAAVDAGDSRMTKAQRARLVAAREYLTVAPIVVNVVRNIALPEIDAMIAAQQADPVALQDLAERWGVSGSISRVQQALHPN